MAETTWSAWLNEQMRDPEFARAYRSERRRWWWRDLLTGRLLWRQFATPNTISASDDE